MLTIRQRGVSLIELMIGVGILSMLLMMGMPAFNLWIQNAQNRSAAESMLNGLQLARAEAVRRNAVVRFDLTDATGLAAWKVGCVTVTATCPATIQSRPAGEGSLNARVGVSTADIPTPTPPGYFDTEIAAGDGLPAGVSFTGMGRVASGNSGVDITRIDVTNIGSADARRFVLTIGEGGQVRMCDPALVFAENPQGCS